MSDVLFRRIRACRRSPAACFLTPLFILLFSLLLSSPLAAQPPEGDVTGVITRLTSSTVTLDGGITAAVIPGVSDIEGGLDSYAVGDCVELELSAPTTGTLPLVIVEMDPSDDCGEGGEDCSQEIRVVGRLEAVAPGLGTITVDGQVFLITGETRVGFDLFGAELGTCLVVEACGDTDEDPKHAAFVGRSNDCGGPGGGCADVERQGRISAIDRANRTFVVGDLGFFVTGATDFDGIEGFLALNVGDCVEVKGCIPTPETAPGGQAPTIPAIADAERVRRSDDCGVGGCQEIDAEGEVLEVTATGEFNIDGYRFFLTDETEFKNGASRESIVAGACLYAKGCLPAPGDLPTPTVIPPLAAEVVALSDDCDDDTCDEIEVEGRVQLINSSDNVIVVRGLPFEITNTTIFEDGLTRAGLTDGLCVEVEGCKPNSDATAVLPIPAESIGKSDDCEDRCRDIEERGRIDAIREVSTDGVSGIVVNGVIFVVNNQTAFEGSLTGLSDLAVGDCVEVEACANAFPLVALSIDLEDDCGGDPDPTDCAPSPAMTGRVTFLSEDRGLVSVDGFPMKVVEGFSDVSEDALENLAIGDCVEFAACLRTAATPPFPLVFLNRSEDCENTDPACPEPGVVEGEIEEIDRAAGKIVVDGTVVLITSETRIVRDENRPVPFDHLIGDLEVRVRGCFNSNGELVATVIRVDEDDDDGDPGDEVRIPGVIEAIDVSNQTLRVADFRVAVTSRTMILGFENERLTFGDLAEGQPVFVKGRLRTDGVVLAEMIKLRDQTPVDEIEVRGRISDIDLTNGALVLNGEIPVLVDENTVIRGEDRATTLTLADLSVGQFVEVEGIVLHPDPGKGEASLPPMPAILALEIKVEGPLGLEFEIEGPIAAINPAFETTSVEIVIRDRSILVTPNTRIFGDNGTPLTIADLAVGQFVEVEGRVVGEDWIARKVKLEDEDGDDRCGPTIEFSGPIEQVANSQMVVAGTAVDLTSETEFSDREGNPITPADLNVGDIVKVEAIAGFAGLIACEVKLLRREGDTPPAPEHIVGKIDAISSETMTIEVAGILIKVLDLTEITSRRGDPLSFADLGVDQLVRVHGQVREGMLLALKIRVLEENDEPGIPARVRGLITGISDDLTSMTVGATPVDLTQEPNIRGFRRQSTDLGDLREGDLVFVSGPKLSNGILVAKHIDILASILTDVDLVARTLTASGVTAQVTTDTLLVDVEDGAIALEDFVIGDLLRIEGPPTGDGQIEAFLVLRLDTVRFSDPIADFLPTVPVVDGSRPGLRSADNTETFGFLSLPEDAISIEPNTLYEVIAQVSSDVSDSSLVPNLRLRFNNQSFQKGAFLSVESVGDGRLSPGPQGREYRTFFTPAAASDGLDDWFVALDLLNVSGFDASDATFFLDRLNVRPVDPERVNVLETLVSQDFDSSSEGWLFGGADGFLPLPLRASGLSGGLDLAASQTPSFGFWNTDTGVAATPGALYRGRFLIRAASDNPAEVPSFRGRLNLSGFQVSSVVSVDSINGSTETADGQGRLYDVYLQVPAGAADGQTILAAFDLAHFDATDALNSPVTLDHFTLERIEIAP
ncbi:MAG: DUF5666 domain-containing protein [Sumerlaeia bacterium]